MTTTLINSADSHVMEPKDLWLRKLPPKLADLGPRSVTEGDRAFGRPALTTRRRAWPISTTRACGAR